MSLTWRHGTYHINLSESFSGIESVMVLGLVDNHGIFGMHFADHRAIHVTHLATAARVHPEPGFPDLYSASRFAEMILHLDWDNATKLTPDAKLFLFSTYHTLIIGARV